MLSLLPQRVYERFLETFPEYKDQVRSYKDIKAGKDAIRVKMTDDSVLYFAWRPERSKEGWILSTSLEGVL